MTFEILQNNCSPRFSEHRDNLRVESATPNNPKNYLEVHFQLFQTDGVSHISHIITEALHELDHQIKTFFLSSDLPDGEPGLKLPGLDYQSAEMTVLNQRIFCGAQSREPEEQLLLDIFHKAKDIREIVTEYISENAIGSVTIRNLFSLPLNLPAALALHSIMNDPMFGNTEFLALNHDFYWEEIRVDQYQTPYPAIRQIISEIFPPGNTDTIHNGVINSLARNELQQRQGIDADIYPDPMEEKQIKAVTLKKELELGNSLRRWCGINDDDLVLSVPTRIVPRKAIEFALEFASEISKPQNVRELVEISRKNGGLGRNKRGFTQQSRVIILLTQNEGRTANPAYEEALKAYAHYLGVELVWGGDFVIPDSQSQKNGTVSFTQSYEAIDLPIFCSVQEGFGNQLEEIIARMPGALPVVFQYPVYQMDIRRYLSNVTSLGASWLWQRDREWPFPLRTLPSQALASAVTFSLDSLRCQSRTNVLSRGNQEMLRLNYSASVQAQRYYRALNIGARLHQAVTTT